MKELFKPMLAASMKGEDQSIETINYPVIASPKLDGIRGVLTEGKEVLSRSLKPIPNHYVQDRLKSILPFGWGLDGELMVAGKFQEVTSAIMGRAGTPEFRYVVFDSFRRPNDPYHQRIKSYEATVQAINAARREFGLGFELVYVQTVTCRNRAELETHVEEWLKQGYEGAIVRDPDGVYKYGRSTWREGGMIKVKPLEDAEAVIVDFEEQMSNTNEQTTNELGRSKRSSSKAGKVGKSTLGKFIAVNKEFGTVKVGTGDGLTEAKRLEIWNNRHRYVGKIITFTFQRIGTKDKPRIPIFKGFRKD